MTTAYTPMVQQYLEVKRQHEDELLFFRLGDFYEMFFEDALTASRELNITLTGRAGGMEEKIPMCGVCLLYTSDAADDLLCVGVGGARCLKKKKSCKIRICEE